MRSLGRPLCAVCKEQVALYGYWTVSSIDNPQPPELGVELQKNEKKTFSFTNIASSNSKIIWRVNGVIQAATGTSLVVDAATLNTTGGNSVEVEVSDQTAFVKEDPGKLLTKKRTWTVAFAGPPFPDLRITALTSMATSVAAGTNLDLIEVTLNSGNVDASNVEVDYFLSADDKITATDRYLGSYTIVLLTKKGGFDLKNPYRVEIPPHTLPGTYYIGAIVDREDKIKELDENNNGKIYSMKITKASCAARLAYDDPLVYPADKGAIGIKAGGTLHPTVTAACNAGSGYLILLSCTGTTPGTKAGSGLTLPLNLDACSTAAYGLVNSTFLQAFMGTLDSNGLGRATLKVPQNTVGGTLTAHMAALVFDRTSGRFRAVTNSVELNFK